MQNVEPYKKEGLIKGFISIPALMAVLGMCSFWYTVTSFDADRNTGASGTSATAFVSKQPDLRNVEDIIERADALAPMQLAQAGQMQEATRAANKLLQRKQHDALANLCAGDVFITGGIIDDGLRCLKTGVGLSRRNKWALHHYAQKLAQVGKMDEAILQYQNLIQMDPKWALAHRELADIYLLRKANDSAAQEYAIVCQLDDKDFDSRKMRGIALAREQNYKDGLNEFVMATAQENQSGIPAILKPILGKEGNNAISRATYELQQQINQRPEDYLPKLRLAQLYMYSGNSSDAKDLLEDAVRSAPNNVELRRTHALCLQQLGEDNHAISEFAQSVKLEEQQQREKTPEPPTQNYSR